MGRHQASIATLLGILLTSGVWAQSPGNTSRDYGAPGPEWLRGSDVFSGWYNEWTPETLGQIKGFSYVITTTHSREIVDKLHALGVRAIFYINPYVLYSPTGIAQELRTREKTREPGAGWYPLLVASPFFQAMDPVEHPDWIWVGQDGYPRRQRCTYEETYHGNIVARQECPNAPGYREGILQGISALLDTGADGFFIDCDEFWARKQCNGPEFKLHTHVDPKLDQSQAWLAIQKQIYEMTKSRGQDKVVLINGWGPQGPADYLRYADGFMLESYIVTHVSTRRSPWGKIQAMATQMAPAVKAGKTVLALSYVGYTPLGMDADAFYSYACARIFAYAWSDYFTLADARATLLYRLRLGSGRSEVRESNGVLYRLFENGVVILNPTNEDRRIKIKTGFSFLREVLTNRRYHPDDEATGASLETPPLEAIIPAQSGRVFLSEP